MKSIDYLSTLFVGIDVSSKTNVVCAINFDSEKLLTDKFANNRPGADELAEAVATILFDNAFKNVMFAMESTSNYSCHVATFLSSCEKLMPFKPLVYCLNPKIICNYKKSFIGLSKTDPIDAYVIADFARVGRIQTKPWRGSQFLALQRLTRHRLHMIQCITREKTYMISNMFLKFSELAVAQSGDLNPFSNNYGATASSVLTEFLSPEDILSKTVEELVVYVCEKGRKRFPDPVNTAKLLQQAARNSYQLDKCLYEPLTISIAASFNCISAFERELKTIDKAIERAIKGLNTNEYQCLLSIPGIGPVFAAGILAEIGTIEAFPSQDALAKYAGLVWTQSQSGDFTADNTKMSKQGNHYLRYYFVEAANSVKNNVVSYNAFYRKKYDEAKTHQHKRALALTARKLIRLVFGLLAKNQLFSDNTNSTN